MSNEETNLDFTAEALRLAEERQLLAMAVAKIGYWDWDLLQDALVYQSGLAVLYGFDPGYSRESLRREMHDRIHPEDMPRVNAAIVAARGGELFSVEFRVQFPSGEIRWLEGKGRALFDEHGKAVRLIGVNIDITDHKLAELALRRSEEELERRVAERTHELELKAQAFQALSEMSEHLHACETTAEAYQVVRGVAQQLFDRDSGAMLVFNDARNLLEVALSWGPEVPTDGVFDPNGCWAVRRGREYCHSVDFDGPTCSHAIVEKGQDASYICVPMSARGEMLGVLYLRCCTAGNGGDWAERQQLARGLADNVVQALANLATRQELKAQSVRDPLTGLYNRRHMIATASRELMRADRLDQSVSLMMIDIDHFKMFNDRHGHEAGDRMLVAVAEYLRKRMRGDDIACRYGGEEFTVIMFSASAADAMAKAASMRDELRTMDVYHFGKSIGSVTLSIGIATFPQHGRTVEELLRAADDALYKAKAAGRDQAVVAELPAEAET